MIIADEAVLCADLNVAGLATVTVDKHGTEGRIIGSLTESFRNP